MIESLKNKLRTIQEELTEKLIETNIKKDVTILGVTGTYEGENNANVIATPTYKELKYFIEKLPEIDFSQITDASSYFKNCQNLTSIKIKNCSHLTSAQDLFQRLPRINKY